MSSASESIVANAKEEKKKVLGIWAYKDDRTDLPGTKTVVWTWDAIEKAIFAAAEG